MINIKTGKQLSPNYRFSIDTKIKIYSKAIEILEEKSSKCMCIAIDKAITLVGYETDIDDYYCSFTNNYKPKAKLGLQEWIKYRPVGADTRVHWFSISDTARRIRILKQVIKDLKAKQRS